LPMAAKRACCATRSRTSAVGPHLRTISAARLLPANYAIAQGLLRSP
jgi:hypothetical protein